MRTQFIINATREQVASGDLLSVPAQGEEVHVNKDRFVVITRVWKLTDAPVQPHVILYIEPCNPKDEKCACCKKDPCQRLFGCG